MIGQSLTTCPRCGWDHGAERSEKSQRFFHAIINAAFLNWPEAHRHRPASVDHLRAWLFVHPKVEFCGTIEANPQHEDQIEELQRLAKLLRRAGTRLFFHSAPDQQVVLRVPASAALRKNGGELGAGAFYGLLDRIMAVIEEETGIARSDLRREGLAAVAPKPRLGRKAA